MPEIPFIYNAPTDTDKELARYRDALLSFMFQVIPPYQLPDAVLTLRASHVQRFMLQAQRLESTMRELKAGMHPQLDAMIERHVTLRALVETLLKAKSESQMGDAVTALANHMDQLKLNGEG